jgi:hypothetical protein
MQAASHLGTLLIWGLPDAIENGWQTPENGTLESAHA